MVLTVKSGCVGAEREPPGSSRVPDVHCVMYESCAGRLGVVNSYGYVAHNIDHSGGHIGLGRGRMGLEPAAVIELPG